MRIFIIIFCFLSSASSYAQDTIPVYKRFPEVPPFSLIKYPDSSKFTKNDLENKKGTIIFNFSPDCDHCHAATTDLLNNIDKLKKVQVVMVTALEFKYVREFYDKFKLEQYSSIIVARDPSYFLRSFYSVKSFPSIYIYNKKGKLIDEYIGKSDFVKIAEKL